MRFVIFASVFMLLSSMASGCVDDPSASANLLSESSANDSSVQDEESPESLAESDTELLDDAGNNTIIRNTPEADSIPEEDIQEMDTAEADGNEFEAQDGGAIEPQSDLWPFGGPYAVGVTLPDDPIITLSGRTLSWIIWYPTLPEQNREEEPYKYVQLMYGEATEDAPLAPGGPWPLVVFSHGNQGIKEQSFFLTEHLARHGYIVVAPDHQFNTALDFDNSKLSEVALERPKDISATIDRILAPENSDPEWVEGNIDSDYIGISGHSFGGYTSLLVGGTNAFIPQDLFDECEQGGGWICDLISNMGTDPIDLSDARVKVSVPLSPAGFEIFTPAGLAENNVPTLVMTGSADQLTPLDTTVGPIYDGLPAPKLLWTIEGGDHYVFSDLCKIPGIASITAFGNFNFLCGDTNPVPHEELHPHIQDAVLAFFHEWLMKLPPNSNVLTEKGASNAHETLSLTAELE